MPFPKNRTRLWWGVRAEGVPVEEHEVKGTLDTCVADILGAMLGVRGHEPNVWAELAHPNTCLWQPRDGADWKFIEDLWLQCWLYADAYAGYWLEVQP